MTHTDYPITIDGAPWTLRCQIRQTGEGRPKALPTLYLEGHDPDEPRVLAKHQHTDADPIIWTLLVVLAAGRLTYADTPMAVDAVISWMLTSPELLDYVRSESAAWVAEHPEVTP